MLFERRNKGCGRQEALRLFLLFFIFPLVFELPHDASWKDRSYSYSVATWNTCPVGKTPSPCLFIFLIFPHVPNHQFPVVHWLVKHFLFRCFDPPPTSFTQTPSSQLPTTAQLFLYIPFPLFSRCPPPHVHITPRDLRIQESDNFRASTLHHETTKSVLEQQLPVIKVAHRAHENMIMFSLRVP